MYFNKKYNLFKLFLVIVLLNADCSAQSLTQALQVLHQQVILVSEQFINSE